MATDTAAFDSQATFRALLLATARPGEPIGLAVEGGTAPEAALRVLLDREVTFAVIGDNSAETDVSLAGRLADETGAGVAPVSGADFLLVLGASVGCLAEAKRGTLEEPSEGATAVCAVGRLGTDGGASADALADVSLRLSGPGIEGESTLFVGGMEIVDAEAIRQSRAYYPLGVDVYLVDEAGFVAGLPRSTRVEVVS